MTPKFDYLRIVVLAWMAICAVFAAAGDAGAKTLSGHYYLGGVREVGSELLLNEDGTYQWFMSYGAVDQTSQGTWQERDGKVVLSATAAKPSRPFLSLKGVEPWSDDATQHVEDARRAVIEARAYAFCPFINHQLAIAGGQAEQPPQAAEATAAPMAGTPEDPATTERKGQDAIAALPTMLPAFHAMRVKARADVDAFQNEKQDSESWARASNALIDTVKSYKAAEDALRQTIVRALDVDEAYRDLFDGDDLHQPLWQYAYFKCSQTVEGRNREPDRTYVAIFADDPDHGLHITGSSKARFKFSDGSVETADRFEGGYAMAILPPGKSIIGVGIDFTGEDESQMRHADFDVKVESQSIIHILLDVTGLIPMAFETLELPIEGDALSYQNGKYTREPSP